MARKIIYLINPISGTRGKSSLQDLISRRTREKQIDFSILPTNAEGSYDFLIPLIEKEQVSDIIICGGDGTVNAVATALKRTVVRIGIIPMGSGNGLAFAAGIPRNPSKALDLIFAGKASPIDGFMINDRFSCMLCGIGFDARVAHEFSRQHKRGLQTYIRVSLSQFFLSSPHSFGIRLPLTAGRDASNGVVGLQNRGRELSFAVDAFFISIANANQFGNHVTIAPKASLHDGLLDIVIAKKTGKLKLVLSVLRQVLGGNAVQRVPANAGKRNILYFQTDNLIILNEEEAPLHIDGDPAPTAREFVISVVRNAFTLIQP
jgi:diacylglycerol kinase (ATP)